MTYSQKLEMIAVFLATLFLYLWLSHMVFGADICLSKKEARHLWPKVHLYWYGRSHCWSNRRGPPRGLIKKRLDPDMSNIKTVEPTTTPWVDIKPDKEVVAQSTEKKQSRSEKSTHGKPRPSNPPAKAGAQPVILYPSLANPFMSADPSLLNSTASTLSYRLMDIDELTAKQSDPPDECCWPELIKDDRGNVVGVK
jgi:hypothetical protein